MDSVIDKLKIDRNSPVSLVDQFSLGLKQMILNGELAPSTRLPAAMKISKGLGVSYRTTELALKKLVDEELIRRNPRGTFVNEEINRTNKVKRKRATFLFYDEREKEYLYKRNLLSCVRDVLFRDNFDVRVETVSSFKREGRDWWSELCLKENNDALIVDKEGTFDQECIELIERSEIPFIFFNSFLESHMNKALWVLSDYGSGTYEMVKRLVDLGHKRIALVLRSSLAGYGMYRTAFLMKQSYISALPRFGIEISEDYIGYGAFEDDGRVETIIDGFLKLKKPPTAIICGCDISAFRTVEFLKSRGLDVPGDISVSGYHDFEIAQLCSPALTTVRTPVHELGRVIGKKLLEFIEGKRETGIVSLPVEFVERDSIAPPPVGNSRSGKKRKKTLAKAKTKS